MISCYPLLWADSLPMVSPSLTALYVRIPSAQARLLDERTNSTGRSKQQVVSELLSTALGAEGSSSAAVGGEVLTLDQAAVLLQVTPEDVLAAVSSEGLPGRRIGREWRFSRPAVLTWLGTGASSAKSVGFSR